MSTLLPPPLLLLSGPYGSELIPSLQSDFLTKKSKMSPDDSAENYPPLLNFSLPFCSGQKNTL